MEDLLTLQESEKIVVSTSGGDLEIPLVNGYLLIRCNAGYPVIQAQSASAIRVAVQGTW